MRRTICVAAVFLCLAQSLTFPAGLKHEEQLAPGTYAAGFAARYGSANCGWVAMKDYAVLIDLPYGVDAAEYLAEVKRTTGKPARDLVLTHLQEGDGPIIDALTKNGISKIQTSPAVAQALLTLSPNLPPRLIQRYSQRTGIGNADDPVELMPFDSVINDGAVAVYLDRQKVLFTGPVGVNGPRIKLPGSNTAAWVEAIAGLEKLPAKQVIPGFGSWTGPRTGPALLERERRFLFELRRQIGYKISDGRSLETIEKEVYVVPDFEVWMPYDTPLKEDIDHVYHELTVPYAPFDGNPPQRSDPRPHALVLIGDMPHEPGHVEEGLRPVFEATGVIPHFALDVRALSAENLAHVRLLVILRDGLERLGGEGRPDNPGRIWMTPEQEAAVVQFVEGGGGFLNLHNSMGLYPEGGPYLQLVGGKFTGHGPLERFRVEVIDHDHYITRGISDFTVADEQHTPIPDKTKVHLLLQSRSDADLIAAAGWEYKPGKGRLCHLAPGHTREALLNPMYQRLMRNAVKWCLGAGD